ncbi:MAG: endonuclease dU [Candidatus Thorarchaeota archaeon SMTZ1-45]|nr:MAG: hypothetical protein AM325_06670 [Candidatus Thorarchaeota archaeon SMTZ1-45]
MSSIYRLDSTTPADATIGWKRGVRVLGVSESFVKNDMRSIMVGVVMRGDLRIDGFSVCTPTIGGSDSTDELVLMFNRLNRKDIRAWMLGGSVVSWFNIVDISELYQHTGTPVICISYHPSEGIEKYLKEYFPNDWKIRLDLLERIGERKPVHLQTGHTLYLSVAGIGHSRAKNLLDKLTIDGRVPEPVRVARTIAAGLHRDFIRTIQSNHE